MRGGHCPYLPNALGKKKLPEFPQVPLIRNLCIGGSLLLPVKILDKLLYVLCHNATCPGPALVSYVSVYVLKPLSL